jgi:hypothetical protein
LFFLQNIIKYSNFNAKKFLKFSNLDLSYLVDHGISYESLSQILLGNSNAVQLNLHETTPKSIVNYINREYAACSIAFNKNYAGKQVIPSLFSKSEVNCSCSFLISLPKRSSYFFLVKKYSDYFNFYLIFASVASRVTHIYIPAFNIFISESMESLAPDIAHEIDLISTKIIPINLDKKPIAIVDMVSNYAHQLINHLSGIQRILDEGMTDFYESIVVSGKHFYGDEELIFPELKGKIIQLRRDDLFKNYSDGSVTELVRIGSVCFRTELKNRLVNISKLRNSDFTISNNTRPILVITTRSDGRRCLNLVQIVLDIVDGLLHQYPNLGVVIDGWVFPESEIYSNSEVVTTVLNKNLTNLNMECLDVLEISKSLKPGVFLGTTVGNGMLKSINSIQGACVYFSHIGTLQHKVAWFTGARGVVHGPKSEISRLDSNWFSCEGVVPPVLISTNDIEDVPVDTERGPGFFDYRINKSENIVKQLKSLLNSSNII